MPLKRSPQLQSLSREHHEGLLLAWKIKQGLATGVALPRIAGYVSWFWSAELENHFQREEAAFLSLNTAPLVVRMREEHEEIEGLLQVLAQIPDEALLDEIAQKINDHIRFEERVLFPWVEEELGVAGLDALVPIVEAKDPPPIIKWTDEFWVRTGTGNIQ